jgi:phosphoketolase
MKRLFRQFSFPGGIPSHVAPEVPGSIHEGGELRYALSHAYGAAFDNPGLIVACVVGDGEAESGPLAASWHSNKFLNPARDGAVLPILHLNGYKIANPTIFDRIDRAELEQMFTGFGYRPCTVEGSDPGTMHRKIAAALDSAVEEIGTIQRRARDRKDGGRRPSPGRGVRHPVPLDHAGGVVSLRHPPRALPPARHQTIRLPRHLPPLRRRTLPDDPRRRP